MTRITIIGKGSMGNAIGGVFAAGGSDVAYVTHGQTGATISGDIVVLAVPHPEVDGILTAFGAQLAGKTVVDITNPLDFSTFDSLVVPADASAASHIQAELPESHVLKAFNTTFAATLVNRQLGGVPTTVLVAGDDPDAKTSLIEAIRAAGVSALDAGALSRARELEAIGFLQLTLAVSEKIGWNGGFAVIR
ncbi:NADPH-dependent F420 reductase [Plantibacter sp. ME-Dv--P-122b]|uniref:NADPH-dependent F420 reductase n=1 Tax=Plantibacter sp. ME-Dv--P-122b TaxID=3040300 RepID=UPI00254BB419|nr:NADPH-dependent F420 reductase [Plantibacter sp. ME-Dv--P-122b]